MSIYRNSQITEQHIDINVVPSFGRFIFVPDQQKQVKIAQVQGWRQKGILKQKPVDFEPSRYASFSVREIVQEPVPQQFIHDYVQRSRLSRRLGF